MAISEPYSRAGVSVTQANLYTITGNATQANPGAITDDGVYQLFVWPSAMVKGDEARVRIYETVTAAGTQKVIAQWSLQGVQSEMFVTPCFILIHGWDMTLQMITSTSRNFDASIRKVA